MFAGSFLHQWIDNGHIACLAATLAGRNPQRRTARMPSQRLPAGKGTSPQSTSSARSASGVLYGCSMPWVLPCKRHPSTSRSARLLQRAADRPLRLAMFPALGCGPNRVASLARAGDLRAFHLADVIAIGAGNQDRLRAALLAENAIAAVIAASLDAGTRPVLETVQVGRPPLQSYRPAPGQSTASSLPATTMVEPAMSLRGASGNGEESGKYNQGKSAGIGFGTVYYVDRILNRVGIDIPVQTEACWSSSPPPRSVSHDRWQPRVRCLVIGVATAKRCLSVLTATGQFTLFAFKRGPVRALFFSETRVRTDPFQY